MNHLFAPRSQKKRTLLKIALYPDKDFALTGQVLASYMDELSAANQVPILYPLL
jgi:hypothetical protein